MSLNKNIPSIAIPIFDDGEEVLTHNASAILVQYGSKRFLCTAAHVFRNQPMHEHRLVAAGPNPFLLGEFRVNKPPEGHPNANDVVDVAATELDDSQVAKCTENSFLVLDPDTPWTPFGELKNLLACGFPNRLNPELPNTVSANAMLMPLKADSNALKHDRRFKDYRQSFISGVFDARHYEMSKAFKGFREYHGMSGGGLFYEDPLSPLSFRELAGMLIEVSVSPRGEARFTAIRTRSIIQLLHLWYSDTPMPQDEYRGLSRRSALI